MRYRTDLPQLHGDLFVTDGGLETTLIFHHGIELPEFAAFDLLKHPQGTETLRSYYRRYLGLAREHGAGFILESPTWRASPGWARRIGYSEGDLEAMNRKAIGLMEEIRVEADESSAAIGPMVISGCIGPEGDGYSPERILSPDAAQAYHEIQIATFADTAADMVTAITMTYADEAIGVALAAKHASIPAVISFTLETDGRLPSGQALAETIDAVEAATDGYPAYYMINCAHPTHFEDVLDGGAWLEKIRGLRANASTRSHEELDEAEDLDDGDPEDLGARYAALREKLPSLNVVGGCCGTDHRHVSEICWALVTTSRT